LSINTNISKEEHRKFFHEFIHYFFENHKRYVYLPKQGADIETVMERYREVGLPGAIGSKDVVHIRWCRYPAEDYNRAKGRYSYPSVAFQCITDFVVLWGFRVLSLERGMTLASPGVITMSIRL
jgi:hypothetical protein